MNEISPVSEVMRAVEYLFEKYKDKPLIHFPPTRRRSGATRAMRSPILQDEHDKILHIYDTQSITVTELARRFGRSVGVVSTIINRNHRLYKSKATSNLPAP